MQLQVIKKSWNTVINLGINYCETSHNIKSIRFLNSMSMLGSSAILGYSLISLFQFNFKYLNLFYLEISFLSILLSLPIFNKIGWINAAKILGVLFNLLYLFLLNISNQNFLGGAYMLLATCWFPMVLYKNKWVYSFLFILHIVAFFAVDLYFNNYPPIIDMPLADLKAAYPGAVITMFMILYFGIQYFMNSNNYYETEIIRTKKQVEEKNREILDSIEYAKRIQNTILPPQKIVSQYLENSFILYLPKDIVAGDFYWAAPLHPKGGEKTSLVEFSTSTPPLGGRGAILFAACDCTGHGVPGAMVSVVCSNALNKAVNEFGLKDPSKILDKVAELVIEDLSKNNEVGDEIQDGMDASLASLNTATGELHWAGANNPLWIIRACHSERSEESQDASFLSKTKPELIEVKPDKQPIGKFDNPKPFTNHTIQLQKGDTIYLFTDGYADQFGGEKGKRFMRHRFKDLLLSIQHLSMNEQREALCNAHIQWRNTQEQVDDICVIGVRV